MAVKAKYNSIKGRSQEFITNWEDRSREVISGFIDLFGKDSMMVNLNHSFLRSIQSKRKLVVEPSECTIR